MKKLIVCVLLFAMDYSFAAQPVAPTPELQSAVQRITNGEITGVETGRSGLTATYEVAVHDPTGAVKEIEVSQKDFTLIEAEGPAVTKEATFNPGHGLKPLAELTDALAKYPKFAVSKWSLEKKIGTKWVYEVSGVEEGTKREYEFNAGTLEFEKAKKK